MNPLIPNNIFKSLENVNLDTLNGYYKERIYYDFNTMYQEKEQTCLKEK